MPVAVEVHKLTKRFGELTAVEELDLAVNKGEVLGLLGPNGAGKTTTVRMLAGIIAPTSGTAEVAGITVKDNVELLHERIGFLTESPGFYERLTAVENLGFFARFYPGVDASPQVARYVELVGLSGRGNDKVGTYSKGMKQRLALARALLHEPEILFLDEPTAGLDPEAAHQVRSLIRKLKSKGRTIFLCTHNLDEAEELCDRIAVFKTRLIALDTPENLKTTLFKRVIIVELEAVNPKITDALNALKFVKGFSLESEKLVVNLVDFDKNRSALVEALVGAGARIRSVYEAEHSMEEIYFTLMAEAKESGNEKK